MVKFDDLINNNMFKCLLLVIIGYCVAKMFYNSCNCSNGVRNGFSVGAACPDGENVCTGTDQTDFCYNKQVIPKFNNDKPGCYPQFYNYSHNCDPSDGRIIIPIDDVVQEGEQPNWSPRCFSWDRDNDPRNAYDCQLENGIESCKEDAGDQLIQNCRKYCNVTMAACMAVKADGAPYQLPSGDSGYKCRELTLRERKDYKLYGKSYLNIISGGQVYEGDDALEQCRAAGCGITCVELAGNIDTCQPNKGDQVAYKDIITCLLHCKHVFVCRKEDGDDCYKTYRIPIDYSGHLDLKASLIKAKEIGFSRIFLETGSILATRFFNGKFINEFKLFISSKKLGKNGNGSIKNYLNTFLKNKKKIVEKVNLSGDKLITYKIK